MYFTETTSNAKRKPVTVELSKDGEYTLAGSERGVYRLPSFTGSEILKMKEKEAAKNKIFTLCQNKVVIVVILVIIICSLIVTIGLVRSDNTQTDDNPEHGNTKLRSLEEETSLVI